MQKGVPDRISYVKAADLTQNLGAKYEYVHRDFKCSRELDAEFFLNERRNEKENESKCAYENAFPFADEDTSYKN